MEADGGPIDVLINNAGVDKVGFLTDASAQDVESLFRQGPRSLFHIASKSGTMAEP